MPYNLTHDFKTNTMSGLTVALALVPEAVAFALIAGVAPLIGLYSAFFLCLITAVFGGRPGMISGATGALAVVAVALVQSHGVEYLFACVLLMGVIQIGAGLMRLGKFIRLVPYPAMLGFVNGLAIVIGLAQLQQFKVKQPDGSTDWLMGMDLYLMLGLVALTMALMHFLPKMTKAIPAALAGILVVSLIVIFGGLDTRTVGDMASIAGGLPQFHIPMVPFNLETLSIIFPYAVIMAAVGLIESLLTQTVVDEMTDTKGRSSKECVAQGAANVVTGFFGGMGGCAMIGQSIINITSGGRTRWSGISAALFLITFILVGAPLIEQIPLAALVGVMFMVVISTFEWASVRLLTKMPRTDVVVMVTVSIVTVFTDLALAVGIGVVISALAFAWDSAQHVYLELHPDSTSRKRIYVIHGQLFFGSILRFKKLFHPKDDPKNVIIDFKYSRVWDHSALEAIDALAMRYKRAGKQLKIRHLSPDCRSFLKRAGSLIEQDPDTDPHYQIVADRTGEV